MPKSDPYWWEEFTPHKQSATDLPEECDVVVVGAGLTGCSAALTLAKSGSNVLLLDAEHPGYGASTRNGGMIGGGYRLSLEQMSKRYGVDTAHELLHESHIDSLAYATSLIREENIDCDFHTCGRFRGQWNRAEYDATSRMLEQLLKLVPIKVEMVPMERQRQEIGTNFYSGGMLLHDHGGLHPAKYSSGLMKAAQRAGAQVHGMTRVSRVTAAGSGFQVETNRGTVRTGGVLMATNGYTTSDFARLKRRIIPVQSFIIATEELPGDLAGEIMPGRRMAVETRTRHCYFRLSPDGRRFIIGGRAALSNISQARATGIMRALMCEIFPQLQSAKISHSWTGQTGFTFSFMPHIGRYDGIWHAMGYSGSGNAMAPYLGHKAALAMQGDPAGKTAFMETTLETRTWYRNHPWFLPFAHTLFRGHDLRDNFTRGR